MKLKVLILNDRDFNSGFGGQVSFIKNLHPHLEKAYTLKYLILSSIFLEQHIIPIRFLYLFKVLFFMIIKKNKFDLIISHSPEASFIVSLFNKPFVHIFHGDTNPLLISTFWYGKYFTFVFHYFENRIVKKANLMYTVGKAREYAKKLKNPINFHLDHVIDFNGRKDFLFAGRLENVKNIDIIIRQYDRLPIELKEMHHLHIIGNGSKENDLIKLVNELNLGENVIFHGLMKYEILIDIISHSLLFLMASSHEGFPMVIAESLTVGTPVISTNVGDIQSVIKDGYNGFLLPLGFIFEDYNEKIKLILSNYEYFSSNAIKSSSVFNAEEIAKYLISDCNKLCNN